MKKVATKPTAKTKKSAIKEAQQPLILRAHRLMEAFAKSDDERDFYLDRQEGFIVYVDLDKTEQELDGLEKEVLTNKERYLLIPKLTFFETKKIMEGFVNEKVYDIDTKEKLLDIIQSKEARANFLEFIYDHHTEAEKWQQYYQERSRIRIIEWLRQNHFYFVFEEDLEFARNLIERLKQSLFQDKIGRDIAAARKILITKAKVYYSNEALNPRPKRGRPPKQTAKQEMEPQITSDVYLTVPDPLRPFIFNPDSTSAHTFSADFEIPEGPVDRRHQQISSTIESESLEQKLAALRQLSSRWVEPDTSKSAGKDDFEDEDEDEDEEELFTQTKKMVPKSRSKPTVKKTPPSSLKKKPVPNQKRRLRPKKGIDSAPSAKKGKVVNLNKSNKTSSKPLKKATPIKKPIKKPMLSLKKSVFKKPMQKKMIQKKTTKKKSTKK